MRTYYGKNKREAREISIKDLICHELKQKGFNFDSDRFGDKSGSWIEIVKISKKPSEVIININFDHEGKNIVDIRVFETPIITILDEDNQKQIA